MDDRQEREYAKPSWSRARVRAWLGGGALIAGLCVAIVGMALGRNGETTLIVGLSVAFVSALRLLSGLIGVAYDD